MEKRKIFFNGDFVNADDAKINVLSPTSQFGLNVFEGLKAYYAKNTNTLNVFRFKDHIKRLFASCRLMKINPTYTEEEIFSFIENLIYINKYDKYDISLRVTFYVYDEGSWSSSDPVGLFIAPVKNSRRRYSKDIYKSATISSYRRISDNNMSPRIKTGANYIAGRYAHMLANDSGYDLPIFLNESSMVSEGAGACLFMVKNNTLYTPPKDASILESITRDTIIKLAKFNSINCYESNITRSMLYDADEVFLCGTTAEITPISMIDGYKFSNQKLTKHICDKYFDVVDADLVIDDKWVRKIEF